MDAMDPNDWPEFLQIKGEIFHDKSNCKWYGRHTSWWWPQDRTGNPCSDQTCLRCGNPLYGCHRPEFPRCHGGAEGNRADLWLCGEQRCWSTESAAGGCKEYTDLYWAVWGGLQYGKKIPGICSIFYGSLRLSYWNKERNWRRDHSADPSFQYGHRYQRGDCTEIPAVPQNRRKHERDFRYPFPGEQRCAGI